MSLHVVCYCGTVCCLQSLLQDLVGATSGCYLIYVLIHLRAAASQLRRFVLAAIKSAAPGSNKELNALEKKLNEAFDPYAN